MPDVARSRTVPAPPEAVWKVIADPRRLPEWWPRVEWVEDVSAEAWTTVQRSRRGREVRADFTRTLAERPRRLAWRQELEATAFERFLAEARVEAALSADGPGRTRVELRAIERARGTSRFGGFMLRHAARKRLDGALGRLQTVLAPEPSGPGRGKRS